MNIVSRLYGILVCVGNKLQSPVLLLLRLAWGWQFFEAGKGKLQDIPKVARFFSQLHIPMPTFNAWLAASTECFGGLLLMLGLCSRLASVPLIITMVVAYLTAHIDTVQTLFKDPDDFLAAPPFPFLCALLVILAFGPGKISLDHLIDRCCSQKKNQPGP